MQNRFHANELLLIYETVVRCGERTDKGHTWQGITAFSSYDGYEIYLSCDGVLLILGFHNKYHLKYDNKRQLDEFENRVSRLMKRNSVLARSA